MHLLASYKLMNLINKFMSIKYYLNIKVTIVVKTELIRFSKLGMDGIFFYKTYHFPHMESNI